MLHVWNEPKQHEIKLNRDLSKEREIFQFKNTKLITK